MLYQSYKNKLEKRRRRFERFWRFRLLFLFALLMLLAAAGALMGVKGQVTKVTVPGRFSYGEPLSMQASSVFGGAGFEYRLQGTEKWSGKMPRAAGVYECRAVGKSIVGTNRPGEIYLFTIDPARTVVRVADGSLVYGEAPSFSADLYYDDVLHVANYTVEERDGAINIVADPEAISVLSAEGEDVTASYIFDVADRDVKEIARPLTVRTASHTFEYDGKPHADEALTLEGYGLAGGHRIEGVETQFASLTDVGTMQNRPTGGFRILDENGGDVTDKYAITEEFGTLEVTPRKLTVTTQGAVIPYDGQAHGFDDIEAVGLAEGQTIRRSDVFSVQNAGEYTNTPRYEIFDGGRRTTDNYEITEHLGAVQVTRRPLSVTAQSETFTYDGTEHLYREDTLTYSDTALAEGHAIRFSGGAYAFTAANEEGYANDPLIGVFSGDENVTDNYDVTVTAGTVVIRRRALTVTTMSETLTYDGTEHVYNDIAAAEAASPDGGLAEAQELRRSDIKIWRAAGTYRNEPAYDIFDAAGRRVTENYEIASDYGTVTIGRRALTVTTATDEFVYDGTPHTYDTVDLGETELMAGDEIRLSGEYTFTEAKAEPYPNRPQIAVYFGGEDVTESYEIAFTYGTVTVERRRVKFRSRSLAGVEYDGAPHSMPEYDDLGGSDGIYKLAEGHTVSANYPAFTAVGTGSNTPTEVKIVAGGADVTANYIIEDWEIGTVEIARRAITLRAGSYEGVYDGAAHRAEDWLDEESRLVAGHYAAAAHYDAYTAAGNYDNDPAGKEIYDGEGNPVTQNYEVTWEKGSIVITKREVALLTGSETVTYDAREHGAATFTATSELKLVDGHEVAAGFQTWIKANEAGYENSFDEEAVQIQDENGGDVTENYILRWAWGTVVILRRHVTVTSGTQSRVYDGHAHSLNTYSAEETNGDRGLAAGHIFRATAVAPSFTNVKDTGENKLEYSNAFIGVDGGENCIENYVVEYVNGTVTITRRPLHVTTASDTFTYDGKEHKYDESTLIYADEGPDAGRAEGQTVVFDGGAYAFTAANEAGHTNAPVIRVVADGENVTENYDVTVVNGKIVILRRALTVRTAGDEFTYDGKDHPYHDIEAVAATSDIDGLAERQEIERTDTKTWRNAGEYTNEPTYDIWDAEGNSAKSNYKITADYGTVRIKVRPLHLLTQTDRFVYDGKWHEYGLDTVKVTDPEEDGNAGCAEGQTLGIVEGAESLYRFIGAREEAYTNRPVVHVFDGEEDVSANYDIVYDYGTVTIDFRPLHVTTGTQSFVYDDTPHDCKEYTITDTEEDTGLADGQTFTVISGTALTDVDEKENILTYHITDENSDEVTGNYKIFETYGTISVTKRHVKVRTGSASLVYDGKPHAVDASVFDTWGEEWGEEGDPYYDLAAGHEPVFVYPQFTDASFEEAGGKYINEPTRFSLVRGNGSQVDFEKNYIIDWEYGTLEIERRNVTLQTDSGEFVYDATPHRVERFFQLGTAGGPVYDLAEGHTLSAVYPERTVVGTTDNIFGEVAIFDAGSNEVTRNYVITWEECGKVTVTKRPVTLTSDGGEHIYDDEDFSIPTYTVEAFNAETDRGLVIGHEFSADVTAPILHDVETRLNELEYDNIKVIAGSEEVTENYEFERSATVFAVLPRPVAIQTGSGGFVYDGNPHSVNTYTVEEFNGIDERGILAEKGHLFSADEVTDTPTVSTVTEGAVGNSFYLNNIKVTAGEKDVTGNYAFEYADWGVLRITPRPITVTLGGGEAVYNGKPQTCENFETDKAADYVNGDDRERGLLEGHTVRPVFAAYLDAGSYPNKLIGETSIVDALGREVSGNYTVIVADGDAQFVITRRPVTVSDLVGGTFVYDGLPHSSDNFTCEEEGEDRGLLTSLGHTFLGAMGIEVTNVTDIMEDGVYTAIGTAPNGIRQSGGEYMVTFWDGTESDVTSNYRVELGEMAPLRVKPRIAVHVYTYSKWYDGTPLFYDASQENYFIEALPPDVEEAWVRVTLGGSITDIGAVTLEEVGLLSECSVWEGGTDRTAENGFEFRGPALPLQVTQRPLRIHVTDLAVEYTGTAYTFVGDENAYWFTFGGLLEGHRLTCNVSGTLDPEQFSAPITLSGIRIVDGAGRDVTEVYDWSVTEGTLSWARDDPQPEAPETGETVADIKRRPAE